MRLSQFLRLAATPLITVPYLLKLKERASTADLPQVGQVLDKLIKSLKNEFSGMSPFPVDELWPYLEGRDVPQQDIEILQKVSVPRARTKHALDPWEVRQAFEQACGKSLLDGINWDLPDPTVLKNIKIWTAGFAGLRKYKRSEHLYQRLTKKVKITTQGHGTEEASWLPGGVLALKNLDKSQSLSASTATMFLIHEIGHAFQEMFGLDDYFDSYGPGHPPFVAGEQKNADEDFAETFRVFEMQPQLLKRKAPAKYEDMARRLKEKLG